MVVEGIMTYQDEQYLLLRRVDERVEVYPLAPAFEIVIGGQWQAVCLKSGGYHGCYVETLSRERMRLALCMVVRMEAPPSPLDATRSTSGVVPPPLPRHAPDSLRATRHAPKGDTHPTHLPFPVWRAYQTVCSLWRVAAVGAGMSHPSITNRLRVLHLCRVSQVNHTRQTTKSASLAICLPKARVA